MNPQIKKPKPTACLCCNQAHPLYRCNEFKRKLCLSAMRWSRVSRCASIVSSKDFKLMNAQKDSLSLSVRDITVCYTMNMHLSNPLATTHRLNPRRLQGSPCRTRQPSTPSQPMTEWFISKLSQSKY